MSIMGARSLLSLNEPLHCIGRGGATQRRRDRLRSWSTEKDDRRAAEERPVLAASRLPCPLNLLPGSVALWKKGLEG